VRLKFVRFRGAGQLTRFICAFPHLQRFATDRSGSNLYDFEYELPTFNLSPHLRVLELNASCMDAILNWYLALPRRPALRAVGLHATRWNKPELIAKFLSALENSLEILFITTLFVAGSQWPFNLNRHTSLRSLQIQLDSFSNGGMLVIQLLSQLSLPQIEEVGLVICTYKKIYPWDEIDAALQRPSFSRLKTVTIRVNQSRLLPEWDHNASSQITDRLPRGRARGILHVYDTGYQSLYLLP